MAAGRIVSDGLNPEPPSKRGVIDYYTVVSWVNIISSYQGPRSKLHVSLKGAPHALMDLLLYCVSFAIHNNPRASGVPEVSCDQSHVMAAMFPQKNNSTNHGKQLLFSTKILYCLAQ